MTALPSAAAAELDADAAAAPRLEVPSIDRMLALFLSGSIPEARWHRRPIPLLSHNFFL
jgi:hypothetical protein